MCGMFIVVTMPLFDVCLPESQSLHSGLWFENFRELTGVYDCCLLLAVSSLSFFGLNQEAEKDRNRTPCRRGLLSFCFILHILCERSPNNQSITQRKNLSDHSLHRDSLADYYSHRCTTLNLAIRGEQKGTAFPC
jgi:hypothetical protein